MAMKYATKLHKQSAIGRSLILPKMKKLTQAKREITRDAEWFIAFLCACR